MATDDEIAESLRVWASYLSTLDGPEGKGGGLIVRAANRWMTLCAWEMRCYAIARWLRHDALDPAPISDPELRAKYSEFIHKSQSLLTNVEKLNRAIGKTTAGSTTMSWDTDVGYWTCGIALAGTCAAFGTGQVLAGIGLGLEAYDRCNDYLDGLDDRDDNDDGNGGNGGNGGDGPRP